MRKKVIAGNWKMNVLPTEVAKKIKEVGAKCNTDEVDVIFCVPSIDLVAALDAVSGTKINIGAQNMHFEDNGAYTGEVSVGMLNSLGVEFVIIGHSERREYFGETDETVNKKVLKAIKNNLTPIICVGEKLDQREQGVTIELVRIQTKIALLGVSADEASKLIIAYEPIWAIGTGKTATSQQAEDVCCAIREVIKEIYNNDVAQKIRIQYGGSVGGANASELFAMPNIDGGLVGGASLKAEFENIVNYNK